MKDRVVDVRPTMLDEEAEDTTTHSRPTSPHHGAWKQSGSTQLRFRVYNVPTYVVQTVLAVIVFATLCGVLVSTSNQSYSSSVTLLSTTVRDLQIDSVKTSVVELMTQPLYTQGLIGGILDLDTIAEEIQEGASIVNRTDYYRPLRAIMSQFSNLTYAGFSMDGYIVMGARTGGISGAQMFIIQGPADNKVSHVHLTNPDGSLTPSIGDVPYDLTTDCSYILGDKIRKPFWYNILYDTTGQLSVANQFPRINSKGEYMGTSAATFSLNTINSIFEGIRPTPNTRAFIVDKDGYLVASTYRGEDITSFYDATVSGGISVTVGNLTITDYLGRTVTVPCAQPPPPPGSRLKATDSWDPVIRKAAEYIASGGANKGTFEIAENYYPDIIKKLGTTYTKAVNATYRYQATREPVGGVTSGTMLVDFFDMSDIDGFNLAIPLDWKVVLVIPDKDFFGEVSQNLKTNLIVGITISVVGLFTFIALSVILIYPISALTNDMRRFQEYKGELRKYRPTQVNRLFLFLRETGRVWDIYTTHVVNTISLSRFAPLAVINLNKGKPIRRQLETGELTVSFMDVRDFTSIAEKITSQSVGQMLCLIFDICHAVIHFHGGMFTDTVGDAVIGFFNQPTQIEDHQTRACLAAVDVCRVIATMDDMWMAMGLSRLVRVRIGINSGLASVGTVGSEDSFKYSALGDPVNVASRLENMGHQYTDADGKKSVVLISSKVHSKLKTDLPLEMECIGKQEVKGKAEIIEVFKIDVEQSIYKLKEAGVALTPQSTIDSIKKETMRSLGISPLKLSEAQLGLGTWSPSSRP